MNDTSIIIIVHNQLKYTRKCIESIMRNTSNYQLILIDNGSTDETLDYFLYDIVGQVIHNETNLGFAKAVNQGLNLVETEYVCLLNNDTIVPHRWLDNMIAHFDKSPYKDKLGLIGCISNVASGLQRDNSYAWEDGELNIQIHADNRNFLFYNMEILSPRIIGLCMLFKKELIDTIGNFDERFEVGMFEDDDFSYRAYKAGYTNIVANDVFIYHYGMTSWANKYQWERCFKENREKFKEKWGKYPEDLWGRIYDKV